MSQATLDRGTETTRMEADVEDGAARPVPAAPASSVTEAPPGRKRRRVVMLIILILVIGAAAIGTYWLFNRQYESTDDAEIEAHVIPIGPQVSARVKSVLIHDNQWVKKGDLLVELDPTDFEVTLEQQRGAEASSRAKLEVAQAQILAADAQRAEANAALEVAQANFVNVDADLKRYQSLDERARSVQQLGNAVAAQKSAAAQVEQAKAKVASAESNLATSKASVLVAEGDLQKASADLRRAEVDLSYTRITAPEDGRVTRKSVEPGEYVTVAQNLFALVSADAWVVANFKETQLDRMKRGQPVTISVDAYPDQHYQGHVDSIQAGTGSRFSMLPAENATGNFVKVVQRVPVKIDFDDGQTGEGKPLLAPGMSVEPRVKVR